MLNGLRMNSPVNEKSNRRRIPWRSALAAVVCGLLIWFVHPELLSRGLRFALVQAASGAGLRLEIGNIHARLAKPIILEAVKIRARNAEDSRTAADAGRVEISLNWPWRALFRDGRLFRALVVEDLRAVVDLRPERSPQRKEVAGLSPLEPGGQANGTLRWFPEYMEVQRGNLEFVALNQSYYFEDISADFSEDRLGTFRAAGAELGAGFFHQSVGSLTGITAWKEGTLYLASLDLWGGVKIERVAAQLARPGGVALGFEATVYGGSLRVDVSFSAEKSPLAIDAAMGGSQVEVAPLAALLGLPGNAEGVIRDMKFTFRGSPDQALDGEASLRLAADGFRWNERGWESLALGGSMIHRRVAISDFELKQKENILTGSGEFSLDEGWPGIARAPFALNATASIRDLAALAGLFGPPFDEMTGRMSLSGSINGQAGKLGGFISLEASGMGFRKRPIDSGRLDVTFSNTEAQISRFEFWSGKDFLVATGTIDIRPPHNYTGEIRVETQDISKYRDFYQRKDFSTIRAGAGRIRWQGDGTASAHSGAFDLTLDDLSSPYTPSGLTGRFAGTYSPENVYFSSFDLEHGTLRFSTRATLARSGIRLNDAVLRSGVSSLAEAEVYLPVDPFEMISGKSPKEAIHRDNNLYARIVSRDPLSIRDLFCLTGNDLPVDGTLEIDLNIGGTPAAPILDGKVQGRGLMRRFAEGSSPPAEFNATFQGSEGLTSFAAELASSGLPPAVLKSEIPFGIVRSADRTLRWMDPEGGISASLEIPRANLAILRPLFADIKRMDGLLAGSLAVSGTIRQPLVEGQLMISGGQLEVSSEAPVLTNLNGGVTFNASRATVEGFGGKMGEGTFEVRGGASLEKLFDPYYELFFYAHQADVARIAGLQAKANISLYASGDNAGGMVKGTLGFVDGRFARRIEITPLLVAPPAEDKVFAPPQYENFIPSFFKTWKLDVSINNETPFLFSGNAASGEIIPQLQLTGTLGNPLLLGHLQLKNARVFLPFTAMTIAEGHLYFVEDGPWIPLLDVRGTVQALDYQVQAHAFGPLSERRVILRSDPPLPQDSLIQLLTTGMAPNVYAPQGPIEMQGAGSPEPVRGKFDSQAFEVVTRANGFQRSNAAPPHLVGRATLRGRFELWRGLSLMNESDVFGLSEGPAYFSLRLR